MRRDLWEVTVMRENRYTEQREFTQAELLAASGQDALHVVWERIDDDSGFEIGMSSAHCPYGVTPRERATYLRAKTAWVVERDRRAA